MLMSNEQPKQRGGTEPLGIYIVGQEKLWEAVTDRGAELNRARDVEVGDNSILGDAVNCFRLAATLSSQGFGDPVYSFGTLSGLLFDQWELHKDPSYLDESIINGRRVLRYLPSTCPPDQRKGSHRNLAYNLMTRFELLGNRVDLDEAISHFNEALSLTPPGHENRATSLNNISSAFLTRFRYFGDRSDLDSGLLHSQSALALTPASYSGRAGNLTNLANGLLTRFKLSGDPLDLKDAIINLRAALASTSSSSKGRIEILNNLGGTLMTQFKHEGNRPALEEAISHLQSASDAMPSGHSMQGMCLGNLATAFMSRFKIDGNLTDLDQAITKFRLAFEATPKGTPNRPSVLSNLAVALMNRFKQTGHLSDLDEAIFLHRDALSSQSPTHPDRWSTLGGLANALLIRFQQIGEISNLDETILLHRQAFALTPTGHPGRSSTLNNLAGALKTRFENTGRRADLEEAIIYLKAAVDLAATDHSSMDMNLNNLAAALLLRFGITGDIADLEAAIAMDRRVLLLRLAGHPNRFNTLNDLANALKQRFDHLGDHANLDEAITSYRESLTLTPMGHVGRSLILNNLANALLIRFERTLNPSDLEEAIAHNESALALRPPGHQNRCTSLNNLANALEAQAATRPDPARVLTLRMNALELTPAGHPERFANLNNLARTLQARFENDHKLEDLGTAIRYHCSALELVPPGHPDRSLSQNNLANALRTRFEQTKDRDDLDHATSLLRESLEGRPKGHPDRAGVLLNLANTIGTQMDVLSTSKQSASVISSMKAEIIGLLKDATSIRTGGSGQIALRAAIAWVDYADIWKDPSALHSFRTSLDVMERVSAAGSSLESRHDRLINTFKDPRLKELAVAGAACAITAGDIELALELLEQGRSVLLTEAGKYRTRVDDVEVLDSALAEQFRAKSRQMESSVMTNGSAGEKTSVTTTEDTVAKYQRLSEDWIAVVEKIRSLPGFESFLKPTPYPRLQMTAMDGPVIVLNVSHQRSDAIIVQPHGPPRLVSLPDAPKDMLITLADVANPRTSNTEFKSMLRDIWKKVAQPIVEVLKTEMKLEKGSRIWWCPTGPTALLPLHAAGDYSVRGQNVPDIYVSSYTPTLSSLLHARQGLTILPSTTPRILVVGQPNTPGQNKLPYVKDEIKRITKITPNVVTIQESDGTREAVLEALGQHPWIHISCHGHVDQDRPFRSNFSLYDGPLTLLDFTRQNLPDAQLAFLSACHSAESNRTRPDDVLHLTAGLQFAGFRRVIGTLWAMCDDDAPRVAQSFYANLLGKDGKKVAKSSAHALHCAAAELRRRGVPFARWTCFVHFGC